MEKLTPKEKVLIKMVLTQHIKNIRQNESTSSQMAVDLEKALYKILPPDSEKSIMVFPCTEAKYHSCDEVAECMSVSKALYRKLWDVLPTKENVSAEDCGSRLEWNQFNGTLVSQNWGKFTNEERIELNNVLQP